MQDTITIINLVKLLKSDLLFKLIMGGWGSSMSLIDDYESGLGLNLSQ